MTRVPQRNASAFLPIALLACCGMASGQDLRNVAPPEVPPVEPVAPAAGTPPPAAADATVLLESLAGIVVVADAEPASLDRRAQGVDVSAVALAQSPAIVEYLQQAIGQPVSLASLQRLPEGIARLLREQGHPFVSAWVPPQDLTGGVVHIVVRPALVEGTMQVVGAHYFDPASYLAWIRQRPGATPDAQALQEDIDWINRNPFRNATLAAEPGDAPGSTRLSLRVRERRPVRAFAGVDNTGTPNTGENRVFAGFNWGNAFGRGDQLSYQYRADPARDRSITHSASYQADLPWRHVLALSAAWSKVTPDLGPIFSQSGKSWQVGAQYRVPQAARTADGVATHREFSAGLDFKYADNNLEFATIPVLGNVTHVAQFSLGYTLSRESAGVTAYVAPQLVLSPGGLTKYNDDAAFDGSRTEAPARYAYLRVDGGLSRRLPGDWGWNSDATAQYSSVPLLGSEQLAGTGANGVRGYPESGAFGDSGLVLRNELRAPALAFGNGATASSLGLFAFGDAAWLRTAAPGAESIRLHSAGIGAAWQFGGWATLDVAYVRPLARDVGGESGAYTHVRLQFAY